MGELRPGPAPGLPRFWGGAVGWIAFRHVRAWSRERAERKLRPSAVLVSPETIAQWLGRTMLFRELAAADLDFRVAKARFYPTLGISATLGYQSFDLLKLVSTPASLAYGLGADLVAPLLNRTAITAGYFTANAKQMQAVLQYERAILSGYLEVIKLLALLHNFEMSYDLQAQQVERLARSIEISSQLFASARADYMEVLLTRRDALEAQMELIENKRRQMSAAVSLYQALGGGWR